MGEPLSDEAVIVKTIRGACGSTVDRPALAEALNGKNDIKYRVCCIKNKIINIKRILNLILAEHPAVVR